MEELLNKKLYLVGELKLFTEKIMNMSAKVHYEEIDSMLEERQKYLDSISSIDEQIKKYEKIDGSEEKDYLKIKNDIKAAAREIYNMDNNIRKNINNELSRVGKILNRPQTSSGLNIKI